MKVNILFNCKQFLLFLFNYSNAIIHISSHQTTVPSNTSTLTSFT